MQLVCRLGIHLLLSNNFVLEKKNNESKIIALITYETSLHFNSCESTVFLYFFLDWYIYIYGITNICEVLD